MKVADIKDTETLAANNNQLTTNTPSPEYLEKINQIEQERKEIIKRYKLILRHARPRLKDDDSKKIKKAFEIAYEAHKDVRRKSGEPYIYHPLEVARIVVDEMGLGATSIVCALLHDVVEDTEIELKDIEGQFGTKISKIIDGLTKIKDASDKSLSMQAENFKKMLLTISEDIRVVFIKIADRLHNMRTLESMPRDKQLKIKSETEFVYAPLAHRLGLYSIKSELEDLCLKFSDGGAYQEIEEKIRKTQPARDRFVKDFIRPIEEALNKQGLQFTIKSRLKSIFSIWNKMEKQGIPFEEVFDLFAIRVIAEVPTIEEEKAVCWRIYSIITDFYQPNPNRLRDWISFPKSTGYESLHVTVMSNIGQWVEVQIRSKRMDDIAEMGLAAHWKYKEKNGQHSHDSGIEEWLKKVRESLEQQDVNALEFLDEFRRNLFAEDVYVFTPKGDLKKLPAGATILDFAFEIHTEVGIKCLGGKVNQKLVPLNYRLKSGDQVEILTSTKIKANEDWLKMVVTAKARNKIKEYVKEGKKDTVREGKEIVLRKLRQLKLTLTHEVLMQLLDYFNIKSESEFFYAVGRGTIDHTLIKKFQEKQDADKENKPQETNTPENKLDKKSNKKELKEIIIGGKNDKIEYSLSQCCNPIPGDEIFGIVTVSKGIKVHRTNCPNAVNIMAFFGDRIIKARWADDNNKVFDVTLKIIGTDRVGLVSDVTRVISSQLKVNITSLAFEVHTGVFEGNISLTVVDTKQADELNEQLSKVDGVVNVTRYNY